MNLILKLTELLISMHTYTTVIYQYSININNRIMNFLENEKSPAFTSISSVSFFSFTALLHNITNITRLFDFILVILISLSPIYNITYLILLLILLSCVSLGIDGLKWYCHLKLIFQNPVFFFSIV